MNGKLQSVFCLVKKVLVVVSCLYLSQLVIADEVIEITPAELQKTIDAAPYSELEMISIATGMLEPINKAPAVATVIKASEIEALGLTDIDEVLEMVPGLHVSNRSLSYNSIYSFRGIYTSLNSQVLILINGIPVTHLFHSNKGVLWKGMPVKAISRIEVIRGPGSALYGADAFAGIINIITKQQYEIPRTEFGFRGGSFGSKAAWLQMGHGFETGIKTAFILEGSKTNGQDELIESDLQSTFDGVSGTSASLAPGPVNLSQESIDARLDVEYENFIFRAGAQHRGDLGSGAGVASALDPSSRYKNDRYNLDLTHETVVGSWELTSQLAYFHTRQEAEENLVIFPPGTDAGSTLTGTTTIYPNGWIGNPEVFENHIRAEFSGFYHGISGHIIRLGVGWAEHDLYKTRETKNFGIDPTTGNVLDADSEIIDVTDTEYVFLREGNRFNRFFFAQDAWSIRPGLMLTTGVRYDHYSDFGEAINPRVALVWDIYYNLIAKVLYGHGFRAPSWAEMNNINNPVTLGSADLDPEQIESFEVSLDYHYRFNFQLVLSLYRYVWEDIIEFVLDSNTGTSTAQNIGKQTGHGFEVESSYDVNRELRIKTNYSLQRSEDEDTGEDPGFSPRQQIYFGAIWQFKRLWRLNGQMHWVIDRNRASGDTREGIDDNRWIDLTLKHMPLKLNWDFSLSVKNILDTDVREPTTSVITNDLPLAGRSFWLEARYRLP